MIRSSNFITKLTHSKTFWGGSCLEVGYLEPPQDTGNFCATEMKKQRDGMQDTETIFVRTNCADRMPLPADQQDQIFQKHPELLLDRGVVASKFAAYFRSASSGGQTKGTGMDPNGGQGGG